MANVKVIVKAIACADGSVSQNGNPLFDVASGATFNLITKLDGAANNGTWDGVDTLDFASAPCSPVSLQINGTPQESIAAGATFNLIATLDGVAGGTYTPATDTLAFTSTGDWIRPSWWLTLPTLTAASEAGYILLHIYENRLNRFTVQVTNLTSNIDWGDGTSVTSNGAAQTRTYTYASIAGTVFVDPITGENLKQVIVAITRIAGAITSVDFTVAALTSPLTAPQYAVDFNLSFPNCTTFLMGGVFQRDASFAKQVKIWALGTLSFFRIWKLIACESLQLPASRSTGNWSGLLQDTGPLRLGDQNWGLATLIAQVIGGRILSHGNLIGNSVTNANYYIANSESLQTMGNITLPIATNISYMINGCLQMTSCGLVTAPNATDVSFFASYNRNLTVLAFSDCAAVTNTTQMILGCLGLQVLIMPNLTRGVNFTSTSIGNYGMNLFASGGTIVILGVSHTLGGIGTASGAQTITITGTPFGVLVTAADATALAIRAVMTGKGYTIAN